MECLFHKTVTANNRYSKLSIPTVLDAAHLVSVVHHDMVVMEYALWKGRTVSYNIGEVMGHLVLPYETMAFCDHPFRTLRAPRKGRQRSLRRRRLRQQGRPSSRQPWTVSPHTSHQHPNLVLSGERKEFDPIGLFRWYS